MRIPRIEGIIERRLLVNFRVDPEVLERFLPEPFEPLLVDGVGLAGVCLIRLRQLRPTGLPAAMGVSSENAAHRVAVRLPDGNNGVYIPRRDTDSALNTLLGGRLFPGEHHRAAFDVDDDGERVEVSMASEAGRVAVRISGASGGSLEPGSVFADLQSASSFFERGSIGYSATRDPGRFDSLQLTTEAWSVAPLTVEEARSSFFDDPGIFPPGSVVFDNALVMRDLAHQWHSGESLYCARAVA